MGAKLIDRADLDTWLAWALLREGRLDKATLQALLAEARAERPGGGSSLARSLVNRGRFEAGALEEILGAAPPAPTPTASPPLRRLGDYELLEEIGAGGMGTVYLARHVQTGVQYALKTLTGADPELLARFQREGEGQARVDDHPHVVRVRSLGREGGSCYLVMDLATGGSLEERLREGLPPPEQAATWVRDLTGAVEHAHQRGVLHRDLKPANVLFEGDVPLLVDFGLAKLLDARSLTATGAALGTPAYMAPEQVDGTRGEVGPAADVYGLGALLYHCLTGRPPFSGKVVYQILLQVLEDRPTPPRVLRPEIPPELESVCLRALAKDPRERYPSARALGEALDAALKGEGRPPSRVRLLWLLPVPALLGLVALALFYRGTPAPPVAATPSPRVSAQGSEQPLQQPQEAPRLANLPPCPGPHEHDLSHAKVLRRNKDPLTAREILVGVLRGAPCRSQPVALRELGIVYISPQLLDVAQAQDYWLHGLLGRDPEAAWLLAGSLLPDEFKPLGMVTPMDEPDARRGAAALWLASQWAPEEPPYLRDARHVSRHCDLPTSEEQALEILLAGHPPPQLPPLVETPPSEIPPWWEQAVTPDAEEVFDEFLGCRETQEQDLAGLRKAHDLLTHFLFMPANTHHSRAYQYMGMLLEVPSPLQDLDRAKLYMVRAALLGSGRAANNMAHELLPSTGLSLHYPRLSLEPNTELALAFLTLADATMPPDSRGTLTSAVARLEAEGRQLPAYKEAYATVWTAFPHAR